MRCFYAAIAALSFITLAVTKADARQFGGYPCVDDCSGHKAGYDWADQHAVGAPAECEDILRRSPDQTSFYEGCVVYTEDPGRGSDEDDAGMPIR